MAKKRRLKMVDDLVVKKILLLKDIWSYFIIEKVSISLPLLPSNIRIILEEITGLIEELHNAKQQIKSLRKRISDELYYLQLYIDKNTYFVNQYRENVNSILHEVKPTDKSGDSINIVLLGEKIKTFLKMIKTKNHLDPLINELEKIILNPVEINDSLILQITSLVADLQSELIFAGYPEDIINKFLDEFKFSYEQHGVDKRTLLDQFKFYKESLSVKENWFEYVFRIRGLKVITMPFTIDDIPFYNPLRHDLMTCVVKMPIYPQEESLLDFESKEEEIFRTQDFTKYDEVAYTDCHARVKISTKNFQYGEHLARIRLQETIDKIRQTYKLNDIEISNNCICIDLENNFVKSQPLCTYTRSNKFDISYWVEGLNNNISKDLADEDSLLNKAGKINAEPWRTKISKARRWYIRGIGSDDAQTEYVCYWISIEYLLKSNSNQSMFNLLKNYALPLLIRLAYENELANLFHYFINKLSRDIPKEIKEIPGIGQFPARVNKSVFAQNILIFLKYSDNDLINYRIKFLYEFCSNPEVQRRSIFELQNRYSFLLSELTRIRNRMVHDSSNIEFNLSYYCSYLRYISSVLIANCIHLYGVGFKPAKLKEGYNEWLQKINQGKLIKIF